MADGRPTPVEESISYTAAVPVRGAYEVIVVGGGPAGVAASIAAARLGRKVLLVEQCGALGGMGTNGLVSALNPYSDGLRSLVGGVGLEVVQRAHERGFLSPRVGPQTWEKGYWQWIPFNIEGMKVILDEIVTESGVDLSLCTTMIDMLPGASTASTAHSSAESPEGGKRVGGLILHAPEGLWAVRGRYFVDCTGDADLAALAGFAFELGDEQGQTMAPTLCSYVAGIDYDTYVAFRESPEWPKAVQRAMTEGVLTGQDWHIPGIFFGGEDFGHLNAGHLFGVIGLSSKDLTRGMIRGRQLAQEFLAFYRKYVPGCERMVHFGTASVLGVRETRRVIGEYVFGEADFLARRSFPDEIGRYNKSVDIHPSAPGAEGFDTHVQIYLGSHHLGPGESYGIPYRCLVPKGSSNLLVAGRCISVDRIGLGTLRDQPSCYITGQAAGAAAALCCEAGVTPLDLDIEHLRQVLREQGMYIP